MNRSRGAKCHRKTRPTRAFKPWLQALEDRRLLTGPIAPIISFSPDQSTVSVSYNSYNYTIPRPVVVPWSYTASGATYWVATTGRDTNPGTSASPFLTINKAVSVAVPGDIVYINSGTYVENLVLTTSGAASKPIIISCAPGALGKVTITPSAVFVTSNPDGSVIDVNAADYIWINGLNIEGPMGRPEAPLTEDYSADGITWQGGGGLGDRATNNVVYANVHCGLKEMHHGGTNIDMEGNVIFANGADSLSHGIYMPADNTTMNGNVVFNNSGYGIQSYPSPQNQIITNNVVWGNPLGGIVLGGAANQVYHNTVAYSGNGTGSIGILYFRGGCTNNTVEDNIAVFNDTDAGWDNGGGAYPSPSNNLEDYNDYISVDPNVPLGGHEVRADPKFVNPTIGDFRLQSGSPCLGKGINTASVSGNPSLTLGAYGGPSIALTAPANNAYVAGTITASASASDSSPITSVQFYLDGTALGAPVTQTPYALSIDTTKYAGGAHVLKATATDSQGLSASSSVNITIDNVPPTVSFTAPANNANTGGTITVSANASDNVSVAGVQFYVDGTAVGAQVTKAPYAISLDTTKYSNGAHTFKATATDEVGNTASSTITVTVDNVPPTVSISAPASNAYVGSTITVSANAADNVSVAGVQFYVDGTALGSVVTTAPYAISLDTTKYSNGVHTLKATATDEVGNTASSTVTVTVDNAPPTVSISAPASNAYVGSTITLSANAADNVSVAGVQFYVDGTALGVQVTKAPYSVSLDTTKYSNGAHTLKATATDEVGNTASSTITVTVDNAPPTVAISAPAGNAYVGSTITLSANAADNVSVAGVQFYVDGTALGVQVTKTPYSVSLDTTKYSNGAHTLKATAIDEVGNTASATVTVTVDNLPPTISFSAPANNATVGGTITVSANASDNVSVAGVQFYIDGTALGAQLTQVPYAVSLDTTQYSAGGHVLKATATDEVGNSTSVTVSITVNNTPSDTTPPTSSVSALPATTLSDSFKVNWSGSDNPGGSGIATFDIYVSDNGGAFTLLLQNTTLTSTTFLGHASHRYGLYSIATDNAGNRQGTPSGAQAATTLGDAPSLYVAALYQQVLKRAPDAGGLALWVQQLNGGMPRAQVALNFLQSREYYGIEVDSYYQSILHRKENAAEQAGWVNALAGGMTETNVQLALLTSVEYQASHPDAASFLTGLYNDVLGRAADTSTFASWQQVLAQPSGRQTVALAFLTSVEKEKDVIGGYYANFLGRPADQAGMSNWIAALQAGTQTLRGIEDAILASEEFFKRVANP